MNTLKGISSKDDLEKPKMKLEVGKQYKTRAGHRAVVFRMDAERDYLAVHAHNDAVCCHKPCGYTVGQGGAYDLVSEWTEPKTGEVWVNVYKDGHGIHPTKIQADKRPALRIACVKVNWTEGQFDE